MDLGEDLMKKLDLYLEVKQYGRTPTEEEQKIIDEIDGHQGVKDDAINWNKMKDQMEDTATEVDELKIQI